MVKKLKTSDWYYAILSGLLAIPIILFADLLNKLLAKLLEGSTFFPATIDLLKHNYVQIIFMISVAVVVVFLGCKARETEKKEKNSEDEVIELLKGMDKSLKEINSKLDDLSPQNIETKKKKNKKGNPDKYEGK